MAEAGAKRKLDQTGPESSKPKPAEWPGGGALDLDRLIHERTRLGVVSALAVNDTLSFSELKKLLAVTDGNLSVHARKLEEADYIKCSKTFEKRFPKTTYRLTPRGRKALDRYLNHMESLIQAARTK